MKAFLQIVDDHISVFMLGLVGIGLILASVFLWVGLIDGTNWVAVCGILFTTSGLGDSLKSFSKGRNQ